MDVRPNCTIYINNLNEKVKKEGKNMLRYLNSCDITDACCLLWMPTYFRSFLICFQLKFCFCRIEEVSLCHLFPVWANHGHSGSENSKNEGTSLCHFQRGYLSHQCIEGDAGLPLLWQTNGKNFFSTVCSFMLSNFALWWLPSLLSCSLMFLETNVDQNWLPLRSSLFCSSGGWGPYIYP